MREDVIYTAALLEGEGYLKYYSYIRKKNLPKVYINKGISIRLAMSDEDVILAQKQRFERLLKHEVNFRSGYFNGRDHKKMYEINLYSNDAYAIMMMIFPFMGSRRQQDIIEAIDIYKQCNTKSRKKKSLEFPRMEI